MLARLPHFARVSELQVAEMAGLLALQEAFYGKEVIVADREMVESAADDILDGAQEKDIAFLVVGDPFGCPPPHLHLRGLYPCLEIIQG